MPSHPAAPTFASVNAPRSAPYVPDGSEPSQTELARYVRRSLIQGVMVLAALMVALAVIGVVFEAELLAFTGWVHRHLGIGGLAAVVFVTDSLISPVSPDIVLVVVAKTPLSRDWIALVCLLGALSAAAGSVAWELGRRLGASQLRIARMVRARRLNRALVTRYGRWAVALGALTPIPFSVTCWIAGMCGMDYRTLAPITLLRIPRFVVYYLAIAHADDLLRALQAWVQA